MPFKSYRDESKTNYGHCDDCANLEQISAGSLQRIADATEKMAVNFTRLQSDLEMYKRWYNEEHEKVNHLRRSLQTYKGVVTKLKKKLKDVS